jgi:serine/threonine protein kinase/formylglycine-generating enzyme required for sulfatase activity
VWPVGDGIDVHRAATPEIIRHQPDNQRDRVPTDTLRGYPWNRIRQLPEVVDMTQFPPSNAEIEALGLAGYADFVRVGRGGFGTVYRARQAHLNRDVAIKILPPLSDEVTRTRFERERHAMGLLSGHPGIVTVHESGYTRDGRPYLVMEYMSGGSLADRVEASGPLPWPEAVVIMAGVSDAVEVAHRAGVLHRDIKPDNILMSSYGAPKLTDFGIASLTGGPQTGTPLITATVEHAAPEVFQGARPTELSDVYSIGSTLFALLSGHAAFRRPTDDNPIPVITRAMHDPVPDLRTVGVPDQLARVVERAMAKEPSHRPTSAAGFAEELRNAAIALGADPGIRTSTSGAVPRVPSTSETSVLSRSTTGAAAQQPPPHPGMATPSGQLPPPFAPSGPSWSGEMPPPPTTPKRSKRGLVAGIAVVAVVAAVAAAVVLTKGGGDDDDDGGALGNGGSTTEATTESSTGETGATAATGDTTAPTGGPETSVTGPKALPTLPAKEGMVEIPAGTYTVGGAQSDANHIAEKTVDLERYFIDEREVDIGSYARFVTDTKAAPPPGFVGWTGTTPPAGADFQPVRGVTPEQAGAYCTFAQKRLPSEAEWEVAARGRDKLLYPWGDALDPANFPTANGGIWDVGSVPGNKSQFGVFDMAGNAWEWVGEAYAEVPAGKFVYRGGGLGLDVDMAMRQFGSTSSTQDLNGAGFRCAADEVRTDATTPSTATPDDPTAYVDEFTDIQSGWVLSETGAVGQGNFLRGYHPPDSFHLQATKENTGIFAFRKTPIMVGDGSVETQVFVYRTETESGKFRYGLAVKATPEGHYDFVVDPRSKKWFVLKNTATSEEEIASGDAPTLGGLDRLLDTLHVDLNGESADFIINGTKVTTVSGLPAGPGDTGFFVETQDETLAHIHFDSITVTGVQPG